MNLENAAGQLTLPKVAHDFVCKNLGMDSDHPYEKCYIVVMEAAMRYKRTCLEDIEEFARLLGLDSEKTIRFGRYVNLMIFRDRLQREENRNEQKQLGEIGEREQSGRKRKSTDLPGEEPPKKKPPPPPAMKTKWVSRDEAVAMPFGPEKIEALLALLDSAPPPKEQSKTMKAFLSKGPRAIRRCIDEHHGGSVPSFCLRWSSGFRIKFAEFCCAGKQHSCVTAAVDGVGAAAAATEAYL